MNKKIVYLSILLLLSLSLGIVGALPVEAQEGVEELETVLARSAAKGFLITLTRPDLAGVTNFYLLDSLEQDTILAELQEVTDFEITAGEWISDVTYQTKAIIQPGDREIALYTGKYDGRWQVEGLDLPTGVVADVATGETTVAPAAPGVVPVQGNGSGQLVFQTQSGGDIYVINADGTGLRRLTDGIDPQLSPDGSRVAFTRWTPQYELFTINTDGSGEQAWASNWRQMKSPTWTADGAKLIFSWQNGGRLDEQKRRVDLQEAAINEDRIAVPSEAIKVEVEDGILKYTIPPDAYWSLKEVDLATGQLIDLPTERHSYGPTGHPTQPNQVIFRGDRGIALHDLDAGASQSLTDDGRDHTPVISPDGSKIAVSYWQDDHWEVHTMNIDGSNRQRLTSTPLTVLADKRQLTSEMVDGKERFVASPTPAWNNAAPTWSPDGSQIAFVTDRTGHWEIWLMNADGSNQRPMFPNGALADISLNYAGVDERMLSWR